MTIERSYDNAPAAPVDFFTGVEVENSPAKGMQTLFVVGLQPVDDIKLRIKQSNAQHVYFGANMSLHNLANDDSYTWRMWEIMVEAILDSTTVDYVTMDILSSQVEGFLESLMSEDNRVIPMISVKLPYSQLLNYNTTIKIDDKGFNQTNPGVWCWSLHELMERSHFTPWSAYSGDSPVI